MGKKGVIAAAVAGVAVCAVVSALVVVLLPQKAPENGCDPNPCFNNGVCTESAGSDDVIMVTCDCVDGFYGDDCSQAPTPTVSPPTDPPPPVDSCDPNPCQNNGLCSNVQGGGFICQCAEGFQGEDCSEVIGDNACSSSPCKNEGNCTTTVTGFRCDCAEGFNGRDCSDCAGVLLDGNQCYYAVTGAFGSYSSAEDTCSRMFSNGGGHLAYIKTNETYAAVKDYMQNIPGLIGYDLAWIGASYDPRKGGDEITWNDGDVTNIGSWWHPGFPHTVADSARYRTAEKMKFDVADSNQIGYQGFVNWNPDLPNYPLCQFTMS